MFGISRRAVGVWVRAHRLNGPEALNPHRRGRAPGEQFALSRRQQAELLQDVARYAPDEIGLSSPVWSRRVLADYIVERFGLELSITTVGHYLARWGLLCAELRGRVPSSTRVSGAPATLWVSWHRPVPRFVGTALVPGPGSVAAGPRHGEIGPPPEYLDVLVFQTTRGAAYFLCLRSPYQLDALREIGERAARTMAYPVALTVCQWPPDQLALLRAWLAESGPHVGVAVERPARLHIERRPATRP